MEVLISLILTLAIIAGQLIKVPQINGGGVTLIDLTVLIITFIGLTKLKFKLKKPPLFITGALVFTIVAIFSLALTPLKLQPSQFLISFFYTVRFTAYALLGWVIYSGAFPKVQKNIPQILIFSGIGLAILGLLQLIFLPDLGFLAKNGWDPHYYRTASTFLDPNFLGGFLVLTLILISSQSYKPRILFILFGLVYIALLTTFSRGSYLAFLVSFLSLAFLKKSFKFGLITTVLFLGLLLGFNIYQISVAGPRGIDRAQSAELRLNTWQQGGALFQQHPILGVGFNAYRYALDQYGLANEEFLSSRGSSTNDSSLLFILATTGILGLFSFLFFLISMMTGNKFNFPIVAGISGLIAQSFFANTLFYPFNLAWIILISSAIFNKKF